MSGISFGRYFNVEGRAARTPAPADGSVIFLPDTVPAALPTSAAITGDTGVTLRYPGTPTASGQLTVTGSCSTVQPVSVVLNYGALSLTANGAWTYTLDTSNPQVQQLLEDVSLLDAYPVWAADGTAGVILTATIWGRQVVITGTTSTTVRLDGQESGGGQLTVTGGSGLLTPITRTLTYGTITVTAAGAWTYTLDPTNPAVIALGPNDHVSDSIVVRTQDGRGSVTLQAAAWGKVQAVITGTTSTTLRLGGTETGGGALTVTGGSGKMANLVQALTYGTITMTDNAWSYTLDPSNPTLIALTPQQSVTDNYTAWSAQHEASVSLSAEVFGKGADPYSQYVTLIIAPVNGAAVDVTGRHSVTNTGAPVTAEYILFQQYSSGYLSIPASPDFVFGAGDFTLEFIVVGSNYGDPGLYCQSEGASSANKKIRVDYWGGAPAWEFFTVDGGGTKTQLLYTVAASTGTQQHLEFGRHGDQWYAFLNGELTNTKTLPLTLPDISAPLILGALVEGGAFTQGFGGRLYGVRITKGVCRHTATFTPPTSFPYP